MATYLLSAGRTSAQERRRGFYVGVDAGTGKAATLGSSVSAVTNPTKYDTLLYPDPAMLPSDAPECMAPEPVLPIGFDDPELEISDYGERLALVASAVGGIPVLCSIPDVAAQNRSRAGWYVVGGIGSNWASNMEQEGWNRETTCYPTDAYFDTDPVPVIPGYR